MFQLLAASAFMSGGQALLGGRQQQRERKLQNEATRAANLQTVLETAHASNSFGRQAMLLRDNAAKMRQSAQEATATTFGTAQQQAAAAGVKGASVNAVLQDIDRELGRAETAIEINQETEQYNLNTRLRSMYSGARSSLYRLQPELSDTAVFLNAATSGMMAAGEMYASTYFNFAGGEA